MSGAEMLLRLDTQGTEGGPSEQLSAPGSTANTGQTLSAVASNPAGRSSQVR
jgi:hypothetical protein